MLFRSHFVLPIAVFLGLNRYFPIYLVIFQIPFLIYWVANLDKRVVFTGRVYRFVLTYMIFVLINEIVLYMNIYDKNFIFLLPLASSIVLSFIYERILLSNYNKLALQKLTRMSKLKIVVITGSFGKTSIKNFLYSILKNSFTTYATPRSVNTFAGILNDINLNLEYDTDIYIVEAGARAKGDIKTISKLLNHKYAIIGEIGEQHMEYFKTIENITKAKYELLYSKNIKKAFVYSGNPEIKNPPCIIKKFPSEVRNISSTLEGTSFEMMIEGKWFRFETKILGRFNVSNLSVAIFMARELKISIENIQRAVSNLEQIPHRLFRIDSGNKLIIDDSFNGNINGMKEGIRLASLHTGRKVIVTPGIVEGNDRLNIELAKEINLVFDIAIITSELNLKVLSENIKRPQTIILKDKSSLENMLKSCTQAGDLVLFANDAPKHI